MQFIYKRRVRIFLLIFCLYSFNYLNIFNMNLTSDWYSYTAKNSVDYYLQGSELAFIGLMYFILGLVFFHALFFNMIKGENSFFGLLNRDIALKLFDYIWYIGSFISVLMILIGINAENSKIYLEKVENEKKEISTSLEKKVLNSKNTCSQIKLINNNLEKIVDLDEKNEIIAFNTICKSANEDNINYDRLNNHCIIEKFYITSSYQEEPLYFESKNITSTQSDALNYMVNICNDFYKLSSLNKDINTYKKAAKKHITADLKKVPEWYILLVLIISFRIVKTTIEIVKVLGKRKKKH